MSLEKSATRCSLKAFFPYNFVINSTRFAGFRSALTINQLKTLSFSYITVIIEKNIHRCFSLPNCVQTVHLYGKSTLPCRYYYPTVPVRDLPKLFRLTGRLVGTLSSTYINQIMALSVGLAYKQ